MSNEKMKSAVSEWGGRADYKGTAVSVSAVQKMSIETFSDIQDHYEECIVVKSGC